MTIRMYTYRNHLNAMQMMSSDTALEVLRELGRTFADGLSQIDKPAPADTSDLWNGLAAYHLLHLEGENPRLDCAHRAVLKMVTDAMYERALDVR